VSVGDEGGFAPNMATAEEARTFVTQAITDTGYTPGVDIAIALDPAASEFYRDGGYQYLGEGRTRTVADHVAYLAALVEAYPIVSIEDGVAQDDLDGWKLVTETLGKRIQLVGDDVFCTNVTLLRDGIEAGIANSILVKVNQIGTLTEMLTTALTAHGGRLQRRHVPPFRRNRGHDHRRPRRRHRLRPDQDRLPAPQRPHQQMEPAHPDRRGTRYCGPLRRPDHPDRPTRPMIGRPAPRSNPSN
jgi:hypothetical protein